MSCNTGVAHGSLGLSTVLMWLFGYPHSNDLVICKDSPDYLLN